MLGLWYGSESLAADMHLGFLKFGSLVRVYMVIWTRKTCSTVNGYLVVWVEAGKSEGSEWVRRAAVVWLEAHSCVC